MSEEIRVPLDAELATRRRLTRDGYRLVSERYDGDELVLVAERVEREETRP